jgi:hypothetical protein
MDHGGRDQMSERLVEEIKRKYPGLAARAAHSTLPAVRLFCLDCMGGSRDEVAACTAPDCFLFPFRLGRRPKGSPPVEREKCPISPRLAAGLAAYRERKKAEKQAKGENDE